MDAGRHIVRSRGYSGLSFRELGKAVGVTSASIHYHFPTKGDLGAALARRYTEDGAAYLATLSKIRGGLAGRMRPYTDIFRSALLDGNRMCLCGIMAAEYDGLPAEVRVEVDRFTDANVRWLTEQLSRQSDGGPDPIRRRALAIFAALQGAQLVARGRGDIAVFDEALEAYRSAGLIP